MKKILVVDDDSMTRAIVREITKKRDLITLGATNGIECLSAIEQHKDIVLILLDVNMPVLDGLETIKHIKKSSKNTLPIVIMSVDSSEKLIKKAKKLKAEGWLCKPIRESELLQFIDAIVFNRT